MNQEELRLTLEDALNNPKDNGESIDFFEDKQTIVSVDLTGKVLLGSKQTERMGRKRQKKVAIDEGILAEARKAYLFPFLGDGNLYRTLLMHLPENRFWQEIDYLVDEHRPDDVATFVKKKFSQGGKRYHWENTHEVVWTKPSSSPHVVLSQREKDKFVSHLIREFELAYGSLEHALNPQIKGYVDNSLRYDDDFASNFEVFTRRTGQVFRTKDGATKEYISRGKRRGKNHFYTDLDHERQKIDNVEQQLHDMDPSCKATLAVASRMFALEYEVGGYRTQVTELEKHLQTEFTLDHDTLKTLREQYRKSRQHQDEHRDGSKRIHPKRLKKAIKRLDTLHSLIHKGEKLLSEFEERIEQFKNVEVSKNQTAPRKVIINTAREDKIPLRNEKLENAVDHLKQMAESRYDDGDILGGQTLRNALKRLGKEYVLARDEHYILLPDVSQPDKIRNADLSLWQAARTTLRRIGWDFGITTKYHNGTEEQIWSVPKHGLNPGMKSLQLQAGILDDVQVKVCLERGYGKGYDLHLEHASATLFSRDYNPRVDPVVAKLGEHRLLGTSQDYRGDVVLPQRNLSKLLTQFDKLGFHPQLHGTVISFNGNPSRVELHPDVVGGTSVYRCSVYGNLPLVSIGADRKKPNTAEQVERALFKS